MNRKISHAGNRSLFSATALPGAIVAALFLFAWLAAVYRLDLRVSGLFYDPDREWFLKYDQPWWFLYRYGTIPGLLLSLGALAGGYLSFMKERFRPYRRQMLVVFFTAVIGGGLLVNAILKPYWGRPRPRDVAAFGGELAFHHPYQRGIPGQGESFPCGHCTMGYVFVALLVFRRQSKLVAYGGAGFGLVYGTLVGLGRIVQGAHFLTDVVASLGVLALTAICLNDLVLPRLEKWGRMSGEIPQRRKQSITSAVVLLAITITLLFMTRRPFFEIYGHTLAIRENVDTIVLQSPVSFTRKHLHYSPAPAGRLLVRAQGFGWIQATHYIDIKAKSEGSEVVIILTPDTSGYFHELNHEIDLRLPESAKGRVNVKIEALPGTR